MRRPSLVRVDFLPFSLFVKFIYLFGISYDVKDARLYPLVESQTDVRHRRSVLNAFPGDVYHRLRLFLRANNIQYNRLVNKRTIVDQWFLTFSE